jgi:hypothetical protein
MRKNLSKILKKAKNRKIVVHQWQEKGQPAGRRVVLRIEFEGRYYHLILLRTG